MEPRAPAPPPAAPPPLPLEEAQRRLVALAPVLPTEHLATPECAGFYLVDPLTARRTQPAAPLSAMDGYAVRTADLPGPWRVIGESAGGHPFEGIVDPGEAVRISTGAVVPQGADAVVLQEDVARDGEALRLAGTAPDPAGRHIRPAGLDFAADAPLLAPGTRLGPAQLGLAIAAGHDHLRVRRPLRLAVIDTGDELASPGHAPEAHQIPASNGAMLAAMTAGLPVVTTRIGPVPDRLDALQAAFEAARTADVVVTSGGASVGDYDLVRPALTALGAKIDFWRVAIKPGKPLLVARRGAQVVLGLPGNPASAFVTGYLFLLPLLRAALGAAQPLPVPVHATLETPVPRGGRRTEFLRARWSNGGVTLDPQQDSGMLLPLARSNALVVREAGAADMPAGATASVYLLGE